jgi:peptide/nickel transport system permease protein
MAPSDKAISPGGNGIAVAGRIPSVESVTQPSAATMLARRVLGHRSFVLAVIVMAVLIVAAIFAPLLAPHDPLDQDLTRRLIPPIWSERGQWEYLLGTDMMGRDYLSRLIYGARVSLLIGFCAMAISGVLGTVLGVCAGYFGGRVDMVITFLLTTRLTLPVVMVSLALVAVVGGSLQTVIIILGCLLWDRFTVVMRSATMQIRNLDYVRAANAIGCSTRRIIFSEILPNITGSLLVIATFEVAHSVLLEAALSFLGLGVQPPTPSWGLMVSEGKDYMLFEPYLVMLPGLAIFVLVLAINLLGDGARDIFAPENRN